MALRTVYCVQDYAKDGEGFVRGRLREFGSMSEALDAMARRRVKRGGMVAFYVEGEPDFEWWSDPMVLASVGNVPKI